MAVDCPSCSLGAGATTATIAGTSPTAPTTTLGGPLTNYDVLFTIGEAVFVGALQFETDYATAAANSQGNFVGTGQAADCEVVPDLGLGFPAFNNCIGPNACGLLGPDTLVAAITSVSGFNTEVGETVVRCTWASVTQPSAGDFEITVVDASDPTTSPISVTVDIGQIAAQDGGAICGNGVIEPGEFCDDGNTISGDGCDSNCLIESPSGNCQIRFGVTNAEVLGALSYDTDYFNAPGEFSGSGGAVECTSLSGDLAAFNDCDTADACPTIPFASRSLASAVISAGGFNTPADMAVCSFVATTIPQPTDFLITVTDATRPDFSPAFANVEVTDISCAATCIDAIDFEGLPAGTIVSEAFAADGLGPIGVDGMNPQFGSGINSAIIFDSSCPGGCSGTGPRDFDLGTPNEDFGGPGIGNGGRSGGLAPNQTPRGNVLIVAENLVDEDGDGLVDEPDDQSGRTVEICFDFSASGPTVPRGLTIMDIDTNEEPGTVEFFDDLGASLGMVELPITGDNGIEDVRFDAEDVSGPVDMMCVTVHGSAAIDDIVLPLSCDDGDPCTVDSCDTLLGCINEPVACTDSSFCTGVESCVDGECVGGAPPCEGGTECATTCNEDTQDCFDPAGTECTDDDDICTDDFCDGAGECFHQFNAENDPSCQSGFHTITFGYDDAILASALQFEVDYNAVDGGFVGQGAAVNCTSFESKFQFAAFNDLDDERTLIAALISVPGVAGPTELMSCQFEAPSPPDPDAFEITVVDASDPDLRPINPPPNVTVTSVVPSQPSSARAFTACPGTAIPGCREPERAAFDRLDRQGVSRDKLKWSWHGATSGSEAYGAPGQTTDYALCVYDSRSNRALVVSELMVGAGSRWRASSGGFAYKDRSGTHAGVSSIRIKNSAKGGTKLQWKASGASLPTPTPAASEQCFAQDPSVIVQAVNGVGACWTASFTDAISNTNAAFKARLP